VLQLRVERLGFFIVREVVSLAAPVRDAVDHAVDELLDGVLADGGVGVRGGGGGLAQGAAEVLGGDDVGGVLRPAFGELDALLLEDRRAVRAGDDGRAVALPFERIVGVYLGRGEPPGYYPLTPSLLRGRLGCGVECHRSASVGVNCFGLQMMSPLRWGLGVIHPCH
jgi:hypothetical protein